MHDNSIIFFCTACSFFASCACLEFFALLHSWEFLFLFHCSVPCHYFSIYFYFACYNTLLCVTSCFSSLPRAHGSLLITRFLLAVRHHPFFIAHFSLLTSSLSQFPPSTGDVASPLHSAASGMDTIIEGGRNDKQTGRLQRLQGIVAKETASEVALKHHFGRVRELAHNMGLPSSIKVRCNCYSVLIHTTVLKTRDSSL